jgi:hypothetical protein
VPAAGRAETILSVGEFGRYAVTIESAQGVALQLIDRMSGPQEIRGRTGEQDGRYDGFFDRGEYKIVTFGPEKGRGDATIAVHPFREKSASPPPTLVELKQITSVLEDFEQLSFSLQVDTRRKVALEAAGRDLADLRLWRDGGWLVDAEQQTEIVEPVAGHPLTIVRLSADLPPGFYLVTAYGGPAQKWGEESGEHPFYLRLGIPRLGEAGRTLYTESPFGIDRWLVPARANLFRLELPEARRATLSAGPFHFGTPFAEEGPGVDITKKSSPPVAEITLGERPDAGPNARANEGAKERAKEGGKDAANAEADDGSLRVITVRAEAGQPYVLQHFRYSPAYPIKGSGDYWVSTVRSGSAADNIDPTVIVLRSPDRAAKPAGGDAGPVAPFAAQVIELDAATPWARRCNLLGTMTLFCHLREAGKYKAVATGAAARFRMEPFLVTRPDGYQTPPFAAAGAIWDLEPGFYVLTIEPDTKGVIDLAISPAGLREALKSWIDRLGQKGTSGAAQGVRGSVRFPRLTLESGRTYTAYSNEVPETKLGFVVRPLPLDLSDPLPVAQAAGESVSVPFVLSEPAMLRARKEDGGLLGISVDGAVAVREPTVEPGLHTATVVVTDSTLVEYALLAEPERLSPAAPLPVLAPPAAPLFPILEAGVPLFLDLDRESAATYLVRATAPGLYRIESTGLLATSGNLRTRTISSLDRAMQNGAGRNFLIQAYLREGDYQVTVATQSRTRGHLGLRLAMTPLLDAGTLKPGVTGRLTLPAGEAAAYWLDIPSEGEYQIESAGIGQGFRCRLEDLDGWPYETPGGIASFTRQMEKGRARLVLLPGAVVARAVTRLAEIVPPPHFEGHGPHNLPLATRISHLWLEPAEGQTRTPDRWRIGVPAPCDLSIDLTGEMQGSLTLAGKEIAFVPPGRGWKGKCEAGEYTLEAVCSRPNNRAAYELEFTVQQLVAGTAQAVTAPATLDLSVGRGGLVELESLGNADVRGTLLDDQGRTVASNDDRADDWNFQIAANLASGLYHLDVQPVGQEEAAIQVRMSMPPEVLEESLTLPADRTLTAGGTVRLFPLAVPAGNADLLLVSAHASEAVACAIEGEPPPDSSAARWISLAMETGHDPRLVLPLPPPRADASASWKYRLRVWTPDERGDSVRFTATCLETHRFDESALRRGIKLVRAAGIAPPLAVARVELEHGGVFQLEGASPALLRSAEEGEACARGTGSLVAVPGHTLWLAAGSVESVRGTRVRLHPKREPSIAITLPRHAPLVCDLDLQGIPAESPVVLTSTSLTGQPGVRLAPSADPSQTTPFGGSMAVGSGSALTLAREATMQTAVVWAAEDGPAPIECRLLLQSVSRPALQTTSLGRSQGLVPAGGAVELTLPPGPKEVRLALGDGLAAALSRNGSIASVHWAAGGAYEETSVSEAGTLTLVNPGDTDGRYALELLPGTLKGGGIVCERLLPTSGTLRLKVLLSDDTHLKLHIRLGESAAVEGGATSAPTFIARDGSVERGVDLAIGTRDGDLLVPHGPGLVMAYLERSGEEGVGAIASSSAPYGYIGQGRRGGELWAGWQEGKAEAVTPPAVIPLQGPDQSFRIDASDARMLHVRSLCPSVSRVYARDSTEVAVHPQGAALDLFVPKGSIEIALRGLAGADLWGAAEFSWTAITPVEEGLGHELLLAPGSTQIFSFAVTRRGPAGIGVRASSDLVDAAILDARGRVVGRGLVQMPDLEPGVYLLALSAPPSGPPLEVRPALAGISPPDTGPPPEVIRYYLELGAPNAPRKP